MLEVSISVLSKCLDDCGMEDDGEHPCTTFILTNHGAAANNFLLT